MAHLFRAATALTKDQSLVPSSYIRWLAMSCKFSLMRSDAILSLAGTCTPMAGVYEHGQYVHTQCIPLCIASETEERQAEQVLSSVSVLPLNAPMHTDG